MRSAAGIYIHWPFCASRCHYCHFLSCASSPPAEADRYARALLREVRESRIPEEYAGWTFDSIYFGGGTPSLIPPDFLREILAGIRDRLPLAKDLEMTLEVNPESADGPRLEAWKEAGCNRVSLGVQSLQNRELRRIGRRHSAGQARDAFHALRRAGFANVSCDLIAGLPGQSRRSWLENLGGLLDLAPEHISLYLLEVHEDTPLGRRVQRGEAKLPPDDRVAGMYNDAVERCRDRGYEHYELSNWTRPGCSSRHNRKYWESIPVLGFGAGSHYALERRRFRNASSVGDYLERVESTGSGLEAEELLEERTWLAEYALMGLRLREGIDLQAFRRKFGFSLESRFPEPIRRFTEWGLLEIRQGCLRLTRAALLVSNEVFQEFLSPEPRRSVDP